MSDDKEQEQDPNSPRYPVYKDEEKRVISFKGTKVTEAWSSDYPVASLTLAEAGFFYYGYKDEVQCFWCGGAVSKWKEGDNPWKRHEEMDSSCKFLKEHKP